MQCICSSRKKTNDCSASAKSVCAFIPAKQPDNQPVFRKSINPELPKTSSQHLSETKQHMQTGSNPERAVFSAGKFRCTARRLPPAGLRPKRKPKPVILCEGNHAILTL